MSKTRYSIAGELGKGGFGVVYLLKGDNGQKLALKTVDLRRIPEDYRERAKDEAKILHALNHQHLVHHVNSYIKHPFLCIITEFCDGGDMDKLVAHLGFRSGLPEKLIVCWLMQTASALNYMHTHSPVVLHRDLKPQNIYVTGEGDVRLGDLGLARKLAGPTDMATTQVGTIVYLSPEIISGQPYNSKSDIWSLGCVFYDITGKKGGEDQMGMMFLLVQVMGGRKLPLPDKYSDGLRNTITHMLTKNPSDRPSAANILSTPVIQNFKRNPQRPVDIINECARREGRQPPHIARDLTGLRGAYSAPIEPEDILVPPDAEKLLSEQYRAGGTVATAPEAKATATQLGAMRDLTLNPTKTVAGISTNSMVLFGVAGRGGGGAGGAGGAAAAASGGSDEDNDTFYDSENAPGLGEEHLLLQIQQCQRECTQGLGTEILEAAYGVIANVRDLSALKKNLQELLGDSKYKRFGAKILQLRALEYGLHKTTIHKHSRTSSQKRQTFCKAM